MEKYMGYLILLLFIVVLLFIFWLITRLTSLLSRRAINREQSKVSITKDLLSFAERIEACFDEIKKYPMLSRYLLQAKQILIYSPFNFDRIKVSSLKDVPDNILHKDQKESFCLEYSKASPNIRKLVNDFSEILGKIYSFKHPIKYFYDCFKKFLILSILEVLITSAHKKEENSNTSNPLLEKPLRKKGQIEANLIHYA